MRIGDQEKINGLEYRIMMGKELLKHYPEGDENLTPECKEAKAFIKQEVHMCETTIVLIKTGS